MNKMPKASQLMVHGSGELPSVSIDSYSINLKDKDDFVNNAVNNGVFLEKLDTLRKLAREVDEDPIEIASTDLKKKHIDAILTEGEPQAAALVHGAIEEFSNSLAWVIRRFLKSASWQKTERLAIGGGFRQSRVGEIAIARTITLLRADDIDLDVVAIHHHADKAGLIGAAHLFPAWTLASHAGILAVDIGGSNIRAGIVELNLDKKSDLSKARVLDFELWRHADESPSRTGTVEELVRMLKRLIASAEKADMSLAPVIGIGCPGRVEQDGALSSGGENLPGGNWEKNGFNLPEILAREIPSIRGEATFVSMHNDAVVQGLSEVPEMQDVGRWGIFTIGTGLGNAHFTNRSAKDAKDKEKSGGQSRKTKGK